MCAYFRVLAKYSLSKCSPLVLTLVSLGKIFSIFGLPGGYPSSPHVYFRNVKLSEYDTLHMQLRAWKESKHIINYEFVKGGSLLDNQKQWQNEAKVVIVLKYQIFPDFLNLCS